MKIKFSALINKIIFQSCLKSSDNIELKYLQINFIISFLLFKASNFKFKFDSSINKISSYWINLNLFSYIPYYIYYSNSSLIKVDKLINNLFLKSKISPIDSKFCPIFYSVLKKKLLILEH